MTNITYEPHSTRTPLAAFLLATGSAALAAGQAVGLPPIARVPVALLAYLGAMALFALCLEVKRPASLIARWDSKRVKKALTSAPEDATIRILQTWVPDVEDLTPFLEGLLIRKGKRFRIEIMLMDPGELEADSDADLLSARTRHRQETRSSARAEIVRSANHFRQMKEKVDKHWVKENRTLNLSVRWYRFMPFGPIYQVGDRRLFVGFYPPHASSLDAPMLELRSNRSELWESFQAAFIEAWPKTNPASTVGKEKVAMEAS
jgi:hypothetical protein